MLFIYGAVFFGIGYLVIKKAVKTAIIEAHEELNKKNSDEQPKVEEHPEDIKV